MIVVNFSTKEYALGQQRLSNSLNGYKKLMLNDYTAIGSPTHQASPYAFKIYAIEAALELDDLALWCDSSLWRVGDLSVIENIIKKDGYMFTESGHYVGQWVNDFQKKYFKLTDEELHQGPGGMIMFSAGFIGLDKNSPIAMEFLKQWKQAAVDGAFRGDWATTRHDQSVGSIIAQRLGMSYQRGGKLMSYIGPGYSKPEASSIMYLQGI
jgi:hypothetical protein